MYDFCMNDKFIEFQKETGISNEMFADLLGVHELTITRYRQGLSIPNAIHMEKISEVSNGRLTLQDFISAKASRTNQ
jgi:predicted transcriptional regulator